MRAVLIIVLLVAAEPPVRRGEDRDKIAPPPPSGRGFLGISLEQADPPEIAGFAENSPGEKAGLKTGDVIIKVKRKTIGSVQDLLELMQKTRPGDRVSVTVTRDGKERTVTVTLGTRPTEP